MKTLINLLFFSTTLLLLSCEKDNEATIAKRSNTIPVIETPHYKSYNSWVKMKSNNGNRYTYTTQFISWVGFGSTTEITVENDVVTTRSYKEFDQDKKVTFAFFETKDQLGQNKKGTAPLTIDQLYDTCAKEYLLADEKTNTIYFKTDSYGIMQTCGIVPKDCVDDCYEGISIESIQWDEKPVH